MIEEGFAIVKAARDRYDGIPRPPIQRNPWNEIECGGHYARAMSSVVVAAGALRLGIRRPAPGAALHAAPHAGELQGLLRRPGGLGQPAPIARRTGRSGTKSACARGACPISTLALAATSAPMRVKVQCGGKAVECSSSYKDGVLTIRSKRPAVVDAGQVLLARLG